MIGLLPPSFRFLFGAVMLSILLSSTQLKPNIDTASFDIHFNKKKLKRLRICKSRTYG